MIFFALLRPLKHIVLYLITLLYFVCLLIVVISLLMLLLELEKNLTNNINKRTTIGLIYVVIFVLTNAGIILFFIFKIIYTLTIKLMKNIKSKN